MARRVAAVAAVLLAVVALAAGPVAGVSQPARGASAANESAIAPGERFAGVVGVQGAEMVGDLERRTFAIRLGRAASDESRAAVVSWKLGEVEATLADLQDRKRALDRARENGTIGDGSYDARMAVIAAKQSILRSQLEASETASASLPPMLREDEGSDGSELRALDEEAAELTDPRRAATVRTIAGPNAGTLADSGSIAPGRGGDVGPGGNRTATGEAAGAVPVDTDPTTTDGGDGDGEDDEPLTIDLG